MKGFGHIGSVFKAPRGPRGLRKHANSLATPQTWVSINRNAHGKWRVPWSYSAFEGSDVNKMRRERERERIAIKVAQRTWVWEIKGVIHTQPIQLNHNQWLHANKPSLAWDPFFWPWDFHCNMSNLLTRLLKAQDFTRQTDPALSTLALFMIPQLTCCLLNPVLKAITFTSALINQTTRTVTCKTA